VCIQNFTENPIYLATVYWLVMLVTFCVTLLYPYYLHQSIYRIKIGLAGALWFLSNFTLHVCANPQDNVTLLVVACAISALSTPVFMILADRWTEPRRLSGKELPSS
jgi:hypothetical protein